MKEAKIKIQMLGGFRIASADGFVEESSKRAPKFWKILQYVIAFRHKPVAVDELIFAIWPEDDQNDHKNSMHNMIHRIRTALQDSGAIQGNEVLLFSGGGYCWNNSMDCEVDCEEFEKLYNRACSEDISDQTRQELLLRAIDLYKGDFLPNASSEMWVIPIASYYRSIYIKCVHAVIDLLIKQEQYAQIEVICKRALWIDQFDIKIHEHHLRAIIKQENQPAALIEYQKMTTVFYEHLGVEPPKPLLALYMDTQRFNNSEEHTLEDLMREWSESADFSGAYLCEYGIFKIVYQLEARSVLRSGKSIYVTSLSLKEHTEIAHGAMPYLQNVIQTSLRKGDLFARAAPNQYVLMMQSLTYEDCKMLIKRIARRFNKKYRSLSLKTNIKPIIPIK